MSRSTQGVLIRYLISGVTAAVVQFSLIAMFVELWHMPFVISSILSYSIAAAVSYCLNHRWSFRSDYRHHKAVPRYVVVIVATFLVNAILFAFLNKEVGMHYMAAQFLTTVVTTILNFVLNSRFTFGWRPAPRRA